jgi:hypothetical protein
MYEYPRSDKLMRDLRNAQTWHELAPNESSEEMSYDAQLCQEIDEASWIRCISVELYNDLLASVRSAAPR